MAAITRRSGRNSKNASHTVQRFHIRASRAACLAQQLEVRIGALNFVRFLIARIDTSHHERVAASALICAVLLPHHRAR